jgi:hypothetical protein
MAAVELGFPRSEAAVGLVEVLVVATKAKMRYSFYWQAPSSENLVPDFLLETLLGCALRVCKVTHRSR